MAYQLRPYQLDLISRIGQSWFDHGNRRVMAQLPTGGGKSVVLASIIKDFANRNLKVLVLAHRQELVNQLVEKVESIVDEPVGVIMAGAKPNYDRDIQVGSVQSMARRLESCPHLDLIVIDECFPAGTMVDSNPIESLQIGDLVDSFNEITSQIERKPIVRLFKKLSSSKVSVNAGGIKIECTEEHPFFTKRGWIAANQLTTEDYLYVRNLQSMSNMRKQLPSNVGVGSEQVLFRTMPINTSQKTKIRDNGGNKSQVCFSTNDRQQSNEQFGNSIEDVRHTQENRSQAIVAGWEWQRRNSSATNTIRCADGSFKRMGDGVNCQNEAEKGQWLSFPLQNRYCESSGKNSRGDRRSISSGNCEKRTGLKENGTLEWVSVESVEIHQQASNGGIGERFVYNIEVLDNHNYFVENILVHNCHHSCSASYVKITDKYPTAKVLGVTATPIRLDGKGFRGVFDDLICGVSVTELIDMGSLSSYKYYGAERSMSVQGIKKLGGDFKASAIEAENPVEIVVNQVIEAQRRHLTGKQSVIFAVSVAHSIAIAEALNSVGIITHHLDGMTDNSERKITMQLFRDKKIQCLTNCALFDEGLDIPSLDGVILARPTASLSRYLQMAGRALRVAEGKEHAIIIDLAGNYERLGMPDDERTWTLDGIEKKKRDKKSNTKRKRNDITGEVEVVSIFDTGTEFIEIANKTVVMNSVLRHWIDLCDLIIAEGIEKGYKAGWAAWKLMASDIEPPLDAWRHLGKKLGYHHAWAKYKQEEWRAK